MTQQERRNYLITKLISENEKLKDIELPSDEEEQKQMLRGLFNIRPPSYASEEFLKIQNEYLQEEIKNKGVVESKNIPFDLHLFLFFGASGYRVGRSIRSSPPK